jgi:hypothetical protein
MDTWWTSGVIVGVHEEIQGAELTWLTEPRDNPFKFGNTEVRSGDSRKIGRIGKSQRKRKIKQDMEQYEEEDFNDALRKGATLVNYTDA